MTYTQTSKTKDLPFCNLVMKGDVASGVAYPTAIAELSCHYHFQSIGRTSVGASAASITAAAEYQRRQTMKEKRYRESFVQSILVSHRLCTEAV